MKKPTKLEVANQSLREENAKLRAIFDEMQKPKESVNQCSPMTTCMLPKPHRLEELATAIVQNRQSQEALQSYKQDLESRIDDLQTQLDHVEEDLTAKVLENSNLQHELERAAR